MTASAPPRPVDRLENHIRAFMDDGLVLTEDVCRFMETTFGAADVETLQAVLADADSSEGESLLDLIFFPDQDLQVAIEPLLTEHRLGEADIAALAARLKRKPVLARLRIAGAERVIPVAMPAFAADAFLSRLHLAWQPEEALSAAIMSWEGRGLAPAGDAAEGRLRLRVRLRNASLPQTPVQVRFLCDFLERLSAEEEDFVNQLDFILVFLKEHPDAQNLYRALMDRKRFLFRHLQKAHRAAEFAARNNMETLVMTGVRTPYFDTACAERELAMIDGIATAVFGRTEWLSETTQRVELGDHPGGLDPAELIRRLS